MAGTLEPLTLALAQVDARVGDLEGNARLVREHIARARDEGAELVLFPELVAHRLPARGPAAQGALPAGAQEALAEVAARRGTSSRWSGTPSAPTTSTTPSRCSRTASCTRSTARPAPNYGVFDEQRYFQAGDDAAVLDLGGARVGLTICEDIWTPGHPAAEEALAGATLIVNASASPYFAGKGRQREQMLVQRARDNLCAVAFCNWSAARTSSSSTATRS